MGDFLPRILHDRVCGVHELVESEFVNESIGLLSVSIKDGWFFPLEGFVVPSQWVWVLQGSRW